MGGTFFAFSIGVATITAAMLGIKVRNKLNQINQEWPTHRCSPKTMLTSFFPFMAPKGVNASDNFKQCMYGMNKSFFDTLISPVMSMINSITAILKTVTDQIQAVRDMIDSLRNKIENAFQDIIDKIYDSFKRIAYLFKAIFGLFSQLIKVFINVFDVLLYSYYTLASAWNGPPGATVRFFCFDKNTNILTLDGYKKIKNIKVNDILENGGKILGKFKFDIQDTIMYNYKGILISGSHLVSENGRWVRVEDSHHGKIVKNYKEKYIYCLYTSNSTIQTDKALFRDYFETNDNNVNMKIFKAIQEYINTGFAHSLYQINLTDMEKMEKIYPWCFSKNTKIDMLNGKQKKIKDIKIGDETKTGEVISILKYANENINLYNYCGIKLSGTNLVKEGEKWTPVYKSELSKRIINSDKYYYCIGTISNIISASGKLFRDFEQTSDENINDNIDSYVENFINNGVKKRCVPRQYTQYTQ